MSIVLLCIIIESKPKKIALLYKFLFQEFDPNALVHFVYLVVAMQLALIYSVIQTWPIIQTL